MTMKSMPAARRLSWITGCDCMSTISHRKLRSSLSTLTTTLKAYSADKLKRWSWQAHVKKRYVTKSLLITILQIVAIEVSMLWSRSQGRSPLTIMILIAAHCLVRSSPSIIWISVSKAVICVKPLILMTIKWCWWPISSRQALTSRNYAPCTLIRNWQAWTAYRPFHGSTVPIRAKQRAAPLCSTSLMIPKTSLMPSSHTMRPQP